MPRPRNGTGSLPIKIILKPRLILEHCTKMAKAPSMTISKCTCGKARLLSAFPQEMTKRCPIRKLESQPCQSENDSRPNRRSATPRTGMDSCASKEVSGAVGLGNHSQPAQPQQPSAPFASRRSPSRWSSMRKVGRRRRWERYSDLVIRHRASVADFLHHLRADSSAALMLLAPHEPPQDSSLLDVATAKALCFGFFCHSK